MSSLSLVFDNRLVCNEWEYKKIPIYVNRSIVESFRRPSIQQTSSEKENSSIF